MQWLTGPGSFVGGPWTFEPWLLVGLAAASLAYGAGLRHIRAAAGRRIVDRGAVASFAGGILVLFLALASPIDAIGADLFSAHMVQHLMLMLAAAPLMVWGRSWLVWLWAMRKDHRRSLGRLIARARFGRVYSALTHPAAVWGAFCGVFVFWHLPGPYGWALRHEGAHILEHATFFICGYAFWSVVMEPSGRRRLDYGGRLLYVATAAVLSALPGALIILTERPFYPVHAEGAARWGLTLLEDQHLAGLIMWIPAGFIYLAAISILLVLWLREAERRAVRLHREMPALAVLVMSAALLGACSDGGSGPARPPFGDPDKGARLIGQLGCGACHTIPGIPGADALVGPPLDRMGRRVFVAGMLRNTPENLTRWIQSPQSIVPGNAMPDIGLGRDEARDIVAYLYTLR